MAEEWDLQDLRIEYKKAIQALLRQQSLDGVL
jgi:hypothetical protein